jgi:4-hydroxy-3-polyprenylbenzoate decarboxylase
MNTSRRVIVGISGASGTIYGVRMVEALNALGYESHVVISDAGKRTLAEETDEGLQRIRNAASKIYPSADIGAAIASGSFRALGMVVAPCSIRSAAQVATGTTSTLLARAADVTLKERRRLILMVRETPLHTGHLRTLTTLSEIGAIIAPPVPAFYIRPGSLDDIIDHSVGRVLDLLDIDNTLAHRWRDPPESLVKDPLKERAE